MMPWKWFAKTSFACALAALAACHGAAESGPSGGPSESAPSKPGVAVTSLPGHEGLAVDTTPKRGPRMLAPEVYLRSYLHLFGGGTPAEVQALAKGKEGASIFDTWPDYLASLGLPDYTLDIPRATETNALMLATLERLGAALCERAAERELHGAMPLGQRSVYAFDAGYGVMNRAAFDAPFDTLHRTFLGYPARLAVDGRADRMFAVYNEVSLRHAGAGADAGSAGADAGSAGTDAGTDAGSARADAGVPRLTPSEAGWAAVCSALIRHPEFQLY